MNKRRQKESKRKWLRYEDGDTIVLRADDDMGDLIEVHYDSDREAILSLARDLNFAYREWRRLQAGIARLNRTANEG